MVIPSASVIHIFLLVDDTLVGYTDALESSKLAPDSLESSPLELRRRPGGGVGRGVAVAE
jgi:hypothetical protein